MRTINRHLYALIANAAKMAGTVDPDELLPYIEESLTRSEESELRAFFGWCHANGKTFGHGNYNERFAEWKASAP